MFNFEKVTPDVFFFNIKILLFEACVNKEEELFERNLGSKEK